MRSRIVAVAVALCVALAACGGGSGADGGDASGEVDPDGVVRVGYDLVAASRGGFTFDPAASGSNVGDLGVYHWVYGALMRPTPDGTLEPDLAQSATVVDQNTIEVVMRAGLTFSDGTPLDAETVKTTLERNLSDPSVRAFRAEFFALESIEITDPNTLVLHIPNGTAPSWFDQYMGGEETVIVPPELDPEAPVGAGPFTVVEYRPEQSVVLEKNPDYWNAEQIRVAGIELINAPDSQTSMSALRAHQVDFARVDDYSLVDAAESAGLETVVEPEDVKLSQFPICKSEEPFSDPRVRRALSLAIDREAINETVFDGAGEPAWGLWPEDSPFHVEPGAGRYDPDAARGLLEEAGYGDGFSFDIIPTSSGSMPEIVQIVQQQWEEIGVTVDIVSSSNFVEDFFMSHDAPMAAIPVVGDSASRLDQFSGEGISNVCDYEDPEVTRLAAELRTVSQDSDEAVQIWADIQEIFVEDVLSISLLFQPAVHVYDGNRLGDVALGTYVIDVPDMWQAFVQA